MKVAYIDAHLELHTYLLTIPSHFLTHKMKTVDLTCAWLDPFCFTQSSLVSVRFLLLLVHCAWISPSLSFFHLDYWPLQLA